MQDKKETLQKQWTTIYREQLPKLAKEKDPVQRKWPVHLDHCFARIVLDNAVGIDQPWTEVVKQPAVENMNQDQLLAAIGLGRKICDGSVDLTELNNKSLVFRGKKRKAEGGDEPSPKVKKQRTDGTVSSYFLPSPNAISKSQPNGSAIHKDGKNEDDASRDSQQTDLVDIPAQIKRIENSDITAFRKKALSLLCEIPRGRYSTYQALSDHITRSSRKTCARAVGSAMRNNPFAPEVPCHRVLANDGSLGGFKGYWGEDGKFASKKHELLYEEGVRFDSRGKVKGPPFREFTL